MEKNFKTIDEYIASFPTEIQQILENIRKKIRDKAPEAEEAISYGMPAFNLNGTYLVYFAAWKNHISLYPAPSGLKNELSPYLSGKGTIKFPLKKPVPYDLVGKIVEFRVIEKKKGVRDE